MKHLPYRQLCHAIDHLEGSEETGRFFEETGPICLMSVMLAALNMKSRLSLTFWVQPMSKNWKKSHCDPTCCAQVKNGHP